MNYKQLNDVCPSAVHPTRDVTREISKLVSMNAIRCIGSDECESGNLSRVYCIAASAA